jgi:plasmid maintenance system killer protein
MKTKEAIRLIRTLVEVLYEAYSIGKTYVGGTEDFEKNINDIVELLQQGEKYQGMYLYSANLYEELKGDLKKYKQMWEELEDRCGGCETINYMGKSKPLRDYMADYKQKYFPKEGD